MSAILDCALELAQQRVRLFPVKLNSKLPAWSDYANKATSNKQELIELFGSNRYNSGIACGKIAENLYLVGFDIDNKEGKRGYETLELMAELGEIFPATWSQKTPSGGEHRLFWSPIPIRQGTNVCGNGIDLRSDGGYLVGPGSTINGSPYFVIQHLPIARFPDWAVERYQKKLASVTTIGQTITAGKPAIDQAYALKRSAEYIQSLGPTSVGSRNNECFKIAAKLKDFGLEKNQAVEVIIEYWQCEPPLEQQELLFTINSAYARSKNPMSIAAPENIPFSDETTPEEKPKDTLDEMNRSFFYYAANGVSRVCEETTRLGKFHLERFPVFQFHEKYAAKKIYYKGKESFLTKVWMEDPKRRTYEYIRFDPSNSLGPDAYNTWRGFSVEPAERNRIYSQEAKDSVDLFLTHCEENLCKNNKDHSKWLLNYMAHIFQCPGEKPEVSLVFRGHKGTGKTIVSVILDHLIGDNSVIISDKTHVLGHFNSIMENKLLVTLDEAFWSGDKSVEGILKDIITGSTRIITHKGAEPYPAKVYDRIIIIGNEEWVVPTSSDERRFAIFEVGDGRQQDRKFFGAMKHGLLKCGGDSLLMRFFMDYPLDKDLVNIAPQTEGLNYQKDQSLNPFHAWWLSCLQDGKVIGSGLPDWPQTISVTDFHQSFINQMGTEKNRAYLPSKISVGMMFKKISPSCSHSTNTAGNNRMYNFSSLAQAREEWDIHRRFKTNWD